MMVTHPPTLNAIVAVETTILQPVIMIHVLFSTAAGTLAELLRARGHTDRIAHFTDSLDWGPIHTGSFDDREAWFDRFAPMDFGSWDWLAESASRFRSQVNADPERLIWISPHCQADIACLHWFLSMFGGAGVKLIVADYPLQGMATSEPPLRLSELQEPQIAELLDSCPRIECSQSPYPADRWRTLMSEAAFLRIVEKDNLRSVDADYFDHFLLKRCSATWVKASRVIGDALGDIWSSGHSPDVEFLFWRMRELVQSGEMTSDGDLPQFGADTSRQAKVRR